MTTSIELRCIELIAVQKGLSPEAVKLESTFEQLEMDSLDKVTLAFDIEETYGIDIPESALATIKSVKDMVKGVELAIETKGKASPSAMDPS